MRRLSARAAALTALALVAGAARAEGVSARIEPGYQNTTNRTTSEGTTTTSEASIVTQKYGLMVDQAPWPLLRLNLGGLLDWSSGTVTNPAQTADVDNKRWNGYGRLDVGSTTARAGAGYERREEVSRVETASAVATSRLISDTISGYALFRPEALPITDLRVSRSHAYDGARVLADQWVDEASLGLRYEPAPPVELRYAYRIANPRDEIKGTDTLSQSQFARATYAGSPVARLSLFGSYEISHLESTTRVTGVGGTVTTQQFPVRGLSALEIFPAVPERITLDQNPALIDGSTSATAGLDIGTRAGGVGIPPPRELAVQFADRVTPVNELRVWVDRRLPADLWGAYTWTAWQSDDNRDWQRVEPVGTVRFDLFENRFEIPIPLTRARYLKVVVSPLPSTISTDPQFAAVLVTELQAFLVEDAQARKGTTTSTRGAFTGSARYAFETVRGLTYDFSTFLRHGSNLDRIPWSVTNGLAYTRRLTRTATLNARLDRTDLDESRGHESSNGYAVSLSAAPLPALQASLTVNGSLQQTPELTSWRNSAVAGATADLYQGVAVSAAASAGYGEDSLGRTVRTTDARVSAAVQPHRSLTLSASFADTTSRTAGGGQLPVTDSAARFEGAGSFSPVPALAFSASHTRYLWGRLAPASLTSFGATASPFSGAPLLVRFSYSESFDTAQELRTRSWGPGLRWNIRPRWFLDATYTRNDTHAPALDTRNDAFLVNLLAIIG